MFSRNGEEFVVWLNMTHPNAYHQITAEYVENLKLCELIHRYGFYSTSHDGKTVMGILKYEQMREKRSANPTLEDKQEPPKCKRCNQPLPPEPEGKKGRPREHCLVCESFRNKERYRKWRKRINAACYVYSAIIG